MTRIVVLHVISGDLWAGAESQVFNTLIELNTVPSLKIICVCFNDGILSRRLREAGVDVVLIDENRFTILEMAGKLWKLFNRLHPSVIHVHHIKEHFLALLARHFINSKSFVIRTLHGLSAVPPGLPWGKYARTSLVVMIDKIMVNFFNDALIAVSNELADQLFPKIRKRSPVYQVYNGLNLDDYCSGQLREISEIRTHFGIPDNVLWIGTAARLVAPKNLPLLIALAEELMNQGMAVHVSVFGEGPLRDQLENMIKTKHLGGIFYLHGFEEDILSIINAFDIFVLCSTHEGLPMALLEAMALKTPVVCSRVGGIGEVIQDGFNGYTFSNGSLEEFVQAIYKMREDIDNGRMRKIVQNAYDTILTSFSSVVMAQKLVDIYDDICSIKRKL